MYCDPSAKLETCCCRNYRFRIEHYAFHLEEFLKENEQVLNNYGYNWTIYYAYLWAKDLDATPFSHNTMTLTLQKFKDLDDVTTNSFDVEVRSRITSVDSYSYADCGNLTRDLCSEVRMFYELQTKEDGYLVRYTEECIDYGMFDLFR